MMMETRKTQGLINTAVASMSLHSPTNVSKSLREERDAIIEDTPKHSVLKAYFDKVIAKECAEDDDE